MYIRTYVWIRRMTNLISDGKICSCLDNLHHLILYNRGTNEFWSHGPWRWWRRGRPKDCLKTALAMICMLVRDLCGNCEIEPSLFISRAAESVGYQSADLCVASDEKSRQNESVETRFLCGFANQRKGEEEKKE